MEVFRPFKTVKRRKNAAVDVRLFFHPPVFFEETVRQAWKSGVIGDEVLFHAGKLPMVFADYVQTMRSYSGFCTIWAAVSHLLEVLCLLLLAFTVRFDG